MPSLRYTGKLGSIEYGPVTRTPYRVYPGLIYEGIKEQDVFGLLARGCFERVSSNKSKAQPKPKPKGQG